MARATRQLIDALERTVVRLRSDVHYRWTDMGACNCGHLAQTVTGESPAEIRALLRRRPGEWAEQAMEYCPGTGLPVEHVFDKLLELGLTVFDIAHIERLSDPQIVRRLPRPIRVTKSFRDRAHVIAYFEAWLGLLREELTLSDTTDDEASSAA